MDSAPLPCVFGLTHIRQTLHQRTTSGYFSSSPTVWFWQKSNTIPRDGALAIFLFTVRELYGFLNMAQTDVCFHNTLLGVNAGFFYSLACFISINTVSMMLRFNLSGIISTSQMDQWCMCVRDRECEHACVYVCLCVIVRVCCQAYLRFWEYVSAHYAPVSVCLCVILSALWRCHCGA